MRLETRVAGGTVRLRTVAAVIAALAVWACSNDSAPGRCTSDAQCGPGRVCDTGACKTPSPVCNPTGTAPAPGSSTTLAGPASQPACDPTAVTPARPSVLATQQLNTNAVGTQLSV